MIDNEFIVFFFYYQIAMLAVTRALALPPRTATGTARMVTTTKRATALVSRYNSVIIMIHTLTSIIMINL